MASSKFLRSFVPFIVLVIGSFVGLAQFRKINYKYGRNDPKTLNKEDLEKGGMNSEDYQFKMADSLRNEYEELRKKIDLDNWKNIRGPRPWEDSKAIQQSIKNENDNRAK